MEIVRLTSAEIAWAQRTALNSSVENVAIYDALNMEDADGDGIKDTDKFGCDLASNIDTTEPNDNETIDPDADDDSDGIANKNDLCPDTELGGLTDLDGCSSDQLADKADASDGEKGYQWTQYNADCHDSGNNFHCWCVFDSETIRE